MCRAEEDKVGWKNWRHTF